MYRAAIATLEQVGKIVESLYAKVCAHFLIHTVT